MIGVQLLKDSDQTTSSSRKSRKRVSRIPAEVDNDDDWFPLDIHEAFEEMRKRKVFDVSDMYTIADAWGWTWEREIKNKAPQRWSQEWEVELAIRVMNKVIELGGTPTIRDCAMILRAAIRAPIPSAFLSILQTTHGLGYVFGSQITPALICWSLWKLRNIITFDNAKPEMDAIIPGIFKLIKDLSHLKRKLCVWSGPVNRDHHSAETKVGLPSTTSWHESCGKRKIKECTKRRMGDLTQHKICDCPRYLPTWSINLKSLQQRRDQTRTTGPYAGFPSWGYEMCCNLEAPVSG